MDQVLSFDAGEAPRRSTSTLAATVVPFDTSDIFIARAERDLGARLPDDFRLYLLGVNGGEVSMLDDDWRIFPVLDDTDRKRAARSASHIVVENQAARRCSGFPASAVAFADNGSGGYLCFILDSSVVRTLGPAVHKWDHETRGLTLVAKSFGSILGARA